MPSAKHRRPAALPCCAQVWGTWWTVCLYHYYLRSCVARKQFTGRAWWRVPFGSARVRNIPFEPLVMVLLPLCGILGELWLGHESYRKLFADNGMFFMDNLNDWQHSTMYAAFMTAGLVDLAAHYLGAPALVEKVCARRRAAAPPWPPGRCFPSRLLLSPGRQAVRVSSLAPCVAHVLPLSCCRRTCCWPS